MYFRFWVPIMNAAVTNTACSCKVGRNIEQYGLDNLNSELVRRRRDENASLRDLADYVNIRVLASALADADIEVSDALYGAVSSNDALTTLYETLTDDDTPTEQRARVQTRLAQLGVNVEAVEADWVTHPTIRKHFRECLDIDTQRTATITIDDARNTIEWARTRCTNVVAQTCARLRNADLISTGPLDVTLTIQITCTTCGETYRVSQLLTDGTCACTPVHETPSEVE